MRIFLRSLIYSSIIIILLAGVAGNFKPISAAGDEPRSVITVNTFADEFTSNSVCSLREAIVAANTDSATMGCTAGSGTDSIVLAGGVYTIEIPGASEDLGATGDLDITANLSITGVSATGTTIDGALVDRVFDIHGAINVTFENLKVTNGQAPMGATNANGENGGGIRSEGNVELDQVILLNNHAGNGGNETGDGGHGGGIYSSGTLNIYDSTIQGNYAGNGGSIEVNNGTPEYAGDGGHGGGVLALGTLTIEDSLIISNHAGNGGSGILSQPSYMGNAGSGGGLANSGSATITASEIRGNYAGNLGSGPGEYSVVSGGDGGGIFNLGSVNILFTEISLNQTGNGKPSALLAGSGGGLHNANGASAFIAASSIYDNVAVTVGLYSRGAGIYNDGSCSMQNTTIARNEIPYEGGGIYNTHRGTVDINASTIAYNESQMGGGIFNYSGGSTTLYNTLITWNVGWQGGYDCEGTLNSDGYNFIRDLTKKQGSEPPYPIVCTITGDMTGVITGTANNPLISSSTELDYYGGETKTLMPEAGSPLIDQGNPGPTGVGKPYCPATDQRGITRPQSNYCDIGAAEVYPQFTVSKNVDVVFTYPGQLITYSIMVTNIGIVAGTGITVHEDLPAGLIFEGPVSLSIAHPEATLALDVSDLPELVTGLSLAAGESVVVYLPVRTEMCYPENEVIRNTARAYTATPQTEGSGYKDIQTGYRLLLPIVVR